MDRFINPYTFAPLVDPVRKEPIGHRGKGSGRRLTGRIEVTVTLETPLLLSGYSTRWVDVQHRLRLPGSCLKGAVRSVHEAAFNGCLRVVDGSFVPGYRAPAQVTSGWTLAVVLSSKGGIPTAFQPCDPAETVWVDAISLLSRWPRGTLPTSGNVVRIYGEVLDTSLGRFELTNVEGVEAVDRVEDREGLADVPGRPDLVIPVSEGEANFVGAVGDQVFLVTDTGVRKQTKRNGTPGRCLWASSILLEERLDCDPDGNDKQTYEDFCHAAAGTNDRRILEQKDQSSPNDAHDPSVADGRSTRWRSETVFSDVKWRGKKIARRALQTGLLFRGDVVWIRRAGDRVTGIKLASIWRESGQGPVNARIGHAHPCLTGDAGTDRVCLTCETFGAADASEGKRSRQSTEEAAQRSYAGHVRFGALTSTAPAVLSDEFNLAPLSSPNPGSGGFYLQVGHRVSPDAPRNEIASHWGSRTDHGGVSPVKGRKFYWHADPVAQRDHWATRNGRGATLPRYEATAEQVRDKTGQTRNTNRTARLVAAGTRLTGTITVDALPPASVAALLASLDPRRLLDPDTSPRRLATHLGGGKPHGLGSATVDVMPHLYEVSARYTSSTPEPHELSERLDPGTWAQLTERTGATSEGLGALLKILDLDGLGDDANLVTYPPSAGWSRFGTQEFRESYQFFQRANGQRLARGPRPWHVLPEATEGDVTLPIIDRGRR